MRRQLKWSFPKLSLSKNSSNLPVDRQCLLPILGQPDLPQLAAWLNDYLAKEREAREQFLKQVSPDVKAEFIAGEVIMHSPARLKHLTTLHNLLVLTRHHVLNHQLGEVLSEKAMIHLTRNDYEPDLVYFGPQKAAEFTSGQTLFPAPDFVVEILSESTERRDRGVKFQDYAAHGIAEYWIIDPDAETVEQYELPAGEDMYRLKVRLREGMLRCQAIQGFAIPLEAIFDSTRCIEQLRRISQ